MIADVKRYLHRIFSIKDLGHVRYFLGLEIIRGTNGMHINQRKYVLDILADTGLLGSKPADTPLPKGHKFFEKQSIEMNDPQKYTRLIGRLLYLNFTRPDITHTVQQLSQFVGSPSLQHWNATLHVLRYLKGCPSKGLYFPKVNSLQPVAFCDAGWASCPLNRRSLTGFFISLGPALLSWRTKKQSTVSRSSAESEYRSMASTTSEVQWLVYLLKDFQIKFQQPINLWCDNMATLHIAANPVFHERTKHVEIDCHVVLEKY